MLIYEGDLNKKIIVLSQLGAEKITFPLNVVDGQTDICFYRVALLLKKVDCLILSELLLQKFLKFFLLKIFILGFGLTLMKLSDSLVFYIKQN